MLVWISWFVIGVIYDITYCYLFFNLIDGEKFTITPKMLGISMICELINVFVIYSGMIIRPIIVNVFYIIIIYVSYKKSILKTINTTLFLFILFALTEILLTFVASVIFHLDIISFSSSILGIIVCNIVCMVLVCLILNIPAIKKFVKSLLSWCDNNKIFKTISLFLIIVFVITILSKQNLFYWKSIPDLLITSLFIICVLFFLFLYLRENMNKNRISNEYDILLKYLNNYEMLLSEKYKQQHEYKNQLILVKGLIPTKNKKFHQYIDSLIQDIDVDPDIRAKYLNQLSTIPQGGLKGLIFYKVLHMREKGINVFIDISEQLKNSPIWNFIEKDLIDISKVVGVYMDNAIEASIHSSQKYIIIEVNTDGQNLIFNFCNTYSGKINAFFMDNEGYSTKGIGKGYGLSLVKDILNRNNHLSQKREINGMYYEQKLIVNNKKTDN